MEHQTTKPSLVQTNLSLVQTDPLQAKWEQFQRQIAESVAAYIPTSHIFVPGSCIPGRMRFVSSAHVIKDIGLIAAVGFYGQKRARLSGTSSMKDYPPRLAIFVIQKMIETAPMPDTATFEYCRDQANPFRSIVTLTWDDVHAID